MDKFNEELVKVPFGTKSLDAVLCVPASVNDVRTAVLLTHGTGGDMNFKHLVSLAHALTSDGFLCLRFTCKGLNLGYRVKAYNAVWDYLKTLKRFTLKNIFLGGRSMGSRAAAALARQLSNESEDAVQGVICLSFPLHPPGNTHIHHQRSEDLKMLPESVRVLFVSGTEDNMCNRDLFNEVLKDVKAEAEVFWLQGGSHGLTVKGRSEDSIMDEVNLKVLVWIKEKQRSMAVGELWNRVNISYPCATSTVHTDVTSATVRLFKALLAENDEVLKLLRSKILQTEIRLLYELMYVLNNSYRGNKTFKGLQQVEQCVNRLKNMKLDAALQELVELCPSQIQMAFCKKTGDCDVPSQPMLEWTCLKVLGAGKLLSCTLSRCSRAFILAKQQMKWEEFLVLNVVITSMLSRLWVFFRGLLVSLSNLYQWLLKLLEAVAQAKPMPFLTDMVLPADMMEFLGPSDALVLKKHPAFHAHLKDHKAELQTRKKASAKVTNKKRMRNFQEDLGVAVERERAVRFDGHVKPFFTKSKSVSTLSNKSKKQEFRKQVGEATTFTLMSASLEEMIQWCRSEGKKKTQCLLTFLRLKCQKMKCLEAAGYNVQRKLQVFRQEVCQALSPQGLTVRTFRFPAATKSTTGRRSHSESLRKRFMLSRARTGVKRTGLLGRQKDSELVVYFKDVQKSKAASRRALQIDNPDSNDDIDDIFAIAGL
ncbi:nucleolus and neural progenitor protein-like [Anableps anableps]